MKFVKDILKGVVIGVANAIPGVSGGTMMVSMGVYDDIIYCITHLFKQLKKSIMILLPYFIGMAIGIIGLAFSIKSLYANFPFQTSMVFIGLILGGVPMKRFVTVVYLMRRQMAVTVKKQNERKTILAQVM